MDRRRLLIVVLFFLTIVVGAAAVYIGIQLQKQPEVTPEEIVAFEPGLVFRYGNPESVCRGTGVSFNNSNFTVTITQDIPRQFGVMYGCFNQFSMGGGCQGRDRYEVYSNLPAGLVITFDPNFCGTQQLDFDFPATGHCFISVESIDRDCSVSQSSSSSSSSSLSTTLLSSSTTSYQSSTTTFQSTTLLSSSTTTGQSSSTTTYQSSTTTGETTEETTVSTSTVLVTNTPTPTVTLPPTALISDEADRILIGLVLVLVGLWLYITGFYQTIGKFAWQALPLRKEDNTKFEKRVTED